MKILTPTQAKIELERIRWSKLTISEKVWDLSQKLKNDGSNSANYIIVNAEIAKLLKDNENFKSKTD